MSVLLRTGFAAASLLCLGAAAQADQMIDPDTLPPKAREFALHGPLGDYDPYGRAAQTGCNWSRVQIPTTQGLKWVAREECQLNFSR